MHPLLPRLVVAAFVALCSGALAAQAQFARVFADHMVLQRDRPVRVWGVGEAGAAVVVRFADQERPAQVGDDGEWAVELAPLAASAEGRELTLDADGQRVAAVADVLVGDVWICGGQSNMAWTVRGTRDADLELASADDARLRFLRLPREARPSRRRDYDRPEPGRDGWRAITPDSVTECTAVGYYFGRRLRRYLRVPVGLVDVSWGGTAAQHWVSRERLRTFPSMQGDLERYERGRAEWLEAGGEEGAERRYAEAVRKWERERAAAEADGARPPQKPRRDAFGDPGERPHPGGMYDGMMYPLRGLTARGVLFYQGENNAFNEAWKPFPDTYPAVVAEWRELFGDPQLPFGLVQIAGWSNRRTMTYDMNHHANIVREVQFDTWRRTPNTGLIVTYDTNSDGNIHPGHKRPVGERAARWALATVYGATYGGDDEPLEWRGPVYDGMEVRGDRVVVRFEDGTARGLRFDQDQALGFYLAGPDREFHTAEARVVDKQFVEVWCADVPEPVAVRYAWSNLPLGTLMNARELPAYPFRSDDWPLVPHRSEGEYVRR